MNQFFPLILLAIVFVNLLTEVKSQSQYDGVDFFLTTSTKTADRTSYNSDPNKWYSLFDPNCPTVFQVHGWLGMREDKNVKLWSGNYLTISDQCYNVISVEWSAALKIIYSEAAKNVPVVGKLLADFITDLSTRNLLNNPVHIAGHSLGAHIAGDAARNTKEARPIELVTGLDPAGPLFHSTTGMYRNYRLLASDSQTVVTLQTNGGVFGSKERLGKINFVANGGTVQPGCLLAMCSHARALDLFAESIISPNFVASDSEGNTAIFGRFMDAGTQGGVYYFDTNSKSPFAKGA